MRKVFAVQIHREPAGVWETVFLSTFLPEAEDTLSDAATLSTLPLRLVAFTVLDLTFIATHARDFAVLDKINF